MRLFSVLIFMFIGTHNLNAQKYSLVKSDIKHDVIKLKFSTRKLYVFCRGTHSKSALIGKKFNLNDTVSTHAGIGLLENGALKIYNVTTDHFGINGALKIENITSYVSDDDIFSLSLWEVFLNKEEMKKARQYLDSYKNKKVFFDYQFKADASDTLYCSEFCANIFTYINKRKFNFSPSVKKIDDEIITIMLKRNEVTYYPIDFFYNNKYFIQTHSFIFNF
jgi:hypothetical protein